jgi:ribonuclease P protein component
VWPVLTKKNRVLTGSDFKSTVRRGRRSSSDHCVVYAVRTSEPEPTRFGFIVAKSVGNAVVRNLMRRRLRSLAADLLPTRVLGDTVVIRMLPPAAKLPWIALRSEISVSIGKAVGG